MVWGGPLCVSLPLNLNGAQSTVAELRSRLPAVRFCGVVFVRDGRRPCGHGPQVTFTDWIAVSIRQLL